MPAVQGGNIGVIGAYVGFCDHYNVSTPSSRAVAYPVAADAQAGSCSNKSLRTLRSLKFS